MLTNSDLTASRANAGTKRVYTNADLDRAPRVARRDRRALASRDTAGPCEHGVDGARDNGRARSATGGARRRRCASAWPRSLEQADTVREQIAAADSLARQGGRRRLEQGGNATSLRARLEALEGRMRLAQDDLAERARREGALPGWLR